MIMRSASSDLHEYLSLAVSALLSERRRSRRKPGGPRTDLGALRQLDPGAFTAKVSSAVASTGGAVDDAARRLEVAPRTLYHYLDTEPALDGVETSSELDDEGRRSRD